MKLSDVATVQVGLQNANFWIVRRGNAIHVGRPTRTYSPEHIGVKIHDTQAVLPDYLYYALMRFHFIGFWQLNSRGALDLVHISTTDIRNLELLPS